MTLRERGFLSRVAAHLLIPLLVLSPLPPSVQADLVLLPLSLLASPAEAQEVLEGVPAGRREQVAQDPLGNVTTFTRSEYVADDGTTGIGPGGGTVRGDQGSELRFPEGALAKGEAFKLSVVSESEIDELFPGGVLDNFLPGTHRGAVLKIESSGTATFKKEVDVVFPLPDFTAVPESERPANPGDAFYYVHRRALVCPDGAAECAPEDRVVVLEVIDEAKVEGSGSATGVVTASPPFPGMVGPATGALMMLGLSWSYSATLISRPVVGVVTGKVLRTKWGTGGAEFEPVAGAIVSATDQAGTALSTKAGGTYSITQQDGKFALWDYSYTGGTVEVVARLDNQEVARGRAYEAVDPTLARYEYQATVNLTLPAAEPPPEPPAVEIVVRDSTSNREIGGAAIAGTSLAISFRSSTTVFGASVNGSGYSGTADGADASLYRVSENVIADQPGNFTIVAVAEAGAGTLEVSRTVRVIAAGGRVDTLPGAAPVVTQVVPRANSKGVAVSSLPQVFFSEPVRNIRDAAASNLTLVDADGAEVPVVLSGVDPDGFPVDQITTASQAVTSVTVQPLVGLRFGTRYRLKLGAEIVDLDPEPKALAAVESDFTTFGPVGVGGSADPLGSAGIVVLGERAYLTRTNSFVNTNLLVYDVADPVEPKEIAVSDVFAPVPYDIVGGEGSGGKVVAVALGSGSRSKPASVAFFDVTTDNPRFVGVSTVANSAYDGFISRIALKGDLVFSATVRKGVQVIDVGAASNAWTALNGSTFEQQKALAKVNTDGEGFGQDAVALTIPLAPKENGTHYWLADIKAGDIQGQTMAVVTGEPGLLVASVTAASMLYLGAPQTVDGFKLVWGQALALGRLSDQDVAVVVTRTHLATVSLAEPANPQILGYVNLTEDLAGLTAVDVILKDDVALVGAQNQLRDQGAVIAVSLTDLAHPVVSGRIDGIGGRLALGEQGLLFGTADAQVGGPAGIGGVRTATLRRFLHLRSKSKTIPITAGATLAVPAEVQYRIFPPDEPAGSVKVQVLQAVTPVEDLIGPFDGIQGEAAWAAGVTVNAEAPYFAQATTDAGLESELVSARVPLPITNVTLEMDMESKTFVAHTISGKTIIEDTWDSDGRGLEPPVNGWDYENSTRTFTKAVATRFGTGPDLPDDYMLLKLGGSGVLAWLSTGTTTLKVDVPADGRVQAELKATRELAALTVERIPVTAEYYASEQATEPLVLKPDYVLVANERLHGRLYDMASAAVGRGDESVEATMMELGVSMIPVVGDAAGILGETLNAVDPTTDSDKVNFSLAVVGFATEFSQVTGPAGVVLDKGVAFLRVGMRTIRAAGATAGVLATMPTRVFNHIKAGREGMGHLAELTAGVFKLATAGGGQFAKRVLREEADIVAVNKVLPAYSGTPGTGLVDRLLDTRFAEKLRALDNLYGDPDAVRGAIRALADLTDEAGQVVRLSDDAVDGAVKFMTLSKRLGDLEIPAPEREALLRKLLNDRGEAADAHLRFLREAPDVESVQGYAMMLRDVPAVCPVP